MKLTIRTWRRSLVKTGPNHWDLEYKWWKPESSYVSYPNETRSVKELQNDGLKRFNKGYNGERVTLISNGYIVRSNRLIQLVKLEPEIGFWPKWR